MSYKIRGEAEVESGFGLPRLTTAQRLAYTPPAEGYKVYDTDLKTGYTHDGTDWIPTDLLYFAIMMSFNLLADTTPGIAYVMIRHDYRLPIQTATATGAFRAKLSVAPSGGTAVYNILKNAAVIGTITFADGSTVGNYALTAATTFTEGDEISFDTVAQNGASGLRISGELERI